MTQPYDHRNDLTAQLLDACYNRAWLRTHPSSEPLVNSLVSLVDGHLPGAQAREVFQQLHTLGVGDATWRTLPEGVKSQIRDLSALTPQLIGLEGWRVEVTHQDNTTRRFIVGRSTGWKPCHIEVARRDSSGGGAVYGAPFLVVTPLYQVR